MSLPSTQRFKSGETARKLKMAVYNSSGNLVDLTGYVTKTYKHRRHGVTGSTNFGGGDVSEVGSPTTHSVEIQVADLTPAFYLVEIDIDDGTGDLISPSIEIEVYEDAG